MMEEHQVTLSEDERKLIIKLVTESTPAYDKDANRLINKLKSLKGED